MKTKFYALVAAVILTAGTISAQSKTYVNVSLQGGYVANSEQDKKIGIGGTVAIMQQDFLFNAEKNYLTLTIKGFNNPILDGKFITSILNEERDCFNYVAPMLGYRMTTGSAANGFYVEPRVGYAFLASPGKAFLVAPQVGYAFNGFDVALFGDLGFSGNPTVAGPENFYTVGLSIGYNIGL